MKQSFGRCGLWLALAGGLWLGLTPAAAQVDVPCHLRPGFTTEVWLDGGRFCPEIVYDDALAPDVTALAVADDGTLYAARPATGDILVFSDTDDDGLPDTPEVYATGLEQPSGLAWWAGSLYVSGGSALYRVRAGRSDVLVSGLAYGLYWTSAITVQDARIYVATSAPAAEDNTAGVVMSYALDGGDAQEAARGLTRPGDLATWGGGLWVNDSAPAAHAAVADLDEINLVTAGAHLGAPLCFGAAQVDLTNAFCLTQSAFPASSLPTGSTPLGMAAYRGSALPALRDALLVVLSGSRAQSRSQGFQIVAYTRADDGQLSSPTVLLPFDPQARYDAQTLNYRNSGFFPRHPLDIAVSPQGWVYISISGGRILALRPPAG